jgi:ABC-type dipeptide/oligopeptide/nickel transport system permease component
MEIFTHLLVWFVGIATGMYAASQIESHIDKRITKGKKK